MDDEIADALRDVRAAAGRPVRLGRGAITRVITAVPAATRVWVETPEGTRIAVRERDYLIDAADYAFDSGPVLPRPGDTIEDQEKTYEVLRRGDLVDCWTYSDRGETTLRVHTREI